MVNKFQDRVKKLRKEKGLKQTELAEKIGVSMYTVSLWERGERYPEMKALKKLSDFFGVTVAYLEGDSYNRTENEGDNAVWLDDDAYLEEMFEKITRMSDDARLVIRDTVNTFFIAEDKQGHLRPEGEYVVSIKKRV